MAGRNSVLLGKAEMGQPERFDKVTNIDIRCTTVNSIVGGVAEGSDWYYEVLPEYRKN